MALNTLRWECLPFEQLNNTQLYKIIQLREKVFVVEQNCPYLDTDDKDFQAKHLMAWNNNQLVAYARLLPPGISYKDASIGRFVTAISVRRSGVGKMLMQKCLEQMQVDFPGQSIRISAQEYLRDFYGSFGFAKQGEAYLEDGIPHVEMLR
ncbi:MAG: GNAT family N-acetyltransferase [Chitinophagales bacterium]